MPEDAEEGETVSETNYLFRADAFAEEEMVTECIAEVVEIEKTEEENTEE